MRQIRSFGSVRAISLDRTEVLRRLREITDEALAAFPEVLEIRLIGSLAIGEQTGTSDVDLFILLKRLPEHPIEGLRPYFFFFSKRLDLALDILVAGPKPSAELERLLQHSLLLASREESPH